MGHDPDIELVAGDSAPLLEATLKSGGSATDLSNASSVQFYMRETGAASLKVNATATIVDAANGKVSYDWASGDLDTPGLYRAEFEVSWNDGDTETFPAGAPLIVQVRAQTD